MWLRLLNKHGMTLLRLVFASLVLVFVVVFYTATRTTQINTRGNPLRVMNIEAHIQRIEILDHAEEDYCFMSQDAELYENGQLVGPRGQITQIKGRNHTYWIFGSTFHLINGKCPPIPTLIKP